MLFASKINGKSNGTEHSDRRRAKPCDAICNGCSAVVIDPRPAPLEPGQARSLVSFKRAEHA
jgi:hypothetical protein